MDGGIFTTPPQATTGIIHSLRGKKSRLGGSEKRNGLPHGYSGVGTGARFSPKAERPPAPPAHAHLLRTLRTLMGR